MNKIDQIIRKLKKILPIIESKYSVKNLEVFGSYIRGEQNYLSDKLGVKVDLVMKDTLKPRIKDRILNEAIPV